MKKMKIDRQKIGLMVAIIGFAFVATLGIIKAYSGGAPKVVVEGDYIESSSPVGELQFGAVGGMYIEDYLSTYFRENSGYYSALGISLTGSDGDFTMSSDGTLTLSGTNTINGTTTVAASYDGFVIQPTVTYATGTVNAVYTNNSTGKALLCTSGSVHADSLNAALGRNFKVSMGTSTSAVAGPGTNLLSTTTVATTTDTVLNLTYTQPFVLAIGESIITWFADVAANATTTYFTSTYWRVQPAINCTLLGG